MPALLLPAGDQALESGARLERRNLRGLDLDRLTGLGVAGGPGRTSAALERAEAGQRYLLALLHLLLDRRHDLVEHPGDDTLALTGGVCYRFDELCLVQNHPPLDWLTNVRHPI